MKLFRPLKTYWSAKSRTAILVFVGCLLVVEAMVRLPGFWHLDPSSGTALEAVRIESALRHAPDPAIVFLGSSRFEFGISPLVIAEMLDLPDTDVAHISVRDFADQ